MYRLYTVTRHTIPHIQAAKTSAWMPYLAQVAGIIEAQGQKLVAATCASSAAVCFLCSVLMLPGPILKYFLVLIYKLNIYLE